MKVFTVFIPQGDGGTGNEDFSQCSIDLFVQVGD
jgi:hypothetical protein